MSPENPNQLNMVTFNHKEDVCPVRQPVPDSAEALANSLQSAREQVGVIPGAFLPPDHRGAALAAGDPEAVRELFKKVLSTPPHEVNVHPLTDDVEQLSEFAANPALLHGDTPEAVANRGVLFQRAHEFAPDAGYDLSLQSQTPSLSLVGLETFVKDKADAIRNGTNDTAAHA